MKAGSARGASTYPMRARPPGGGQEGPACQVLLQPWLGQGRAEAQSQGHVGALAGNSGHARLCPGQRRPRRKAAAPAWRVLVCRRTEGEQELWSQRPADGGSGGSPLRRERGGEERSTGGPGVLGDWGRLKGEGKRPGVLGFSEGRRSAVIMGGSQKQGVTREDVDGQLMEDAADDVDDAHDDELVNVYDKENPLIAVGKLFPNMDEFRMCFKTYAIKHEFDAKTKWTDRKKFYARCRGFDGSVKPCKWRKCAAEPLVVEDCWPKKKKRGNGYRKKRSYGETMQTEQNEQDLDVLQNEKQDLDVFQNEDVVQNEQDLDVLQNQDVVQNEQDMDLVPNNYLRADVVQAEPILEVVLPNPVFSEDVVQNEQDMDLVPNDYLPADVVQAEPILEVVLPNPVFPQDVVPTKPILEVLLPTELDDIPADAVMKTKSLSELGIVVKRSTDKKKKKKLK
ncbi:hypothetical protein D1007_25644 [Hordeum vulgare]|nr:hypothetical protein D1007_25644 [Hordeum vulgare]